MEIYRAGIEDIESAALLFDLYRQFYGQPADIARANTYIAERLKKGESVLFLAKNDGIPMGFTQLYPSFSSISMKKTWILNDLYVQDAFRKQGIGEQLLQKARDYAIETEAAGISLSTATDNASAQRLYEKNGYVLDTKYHHYELSL